MQIEVAYTRIGLYLQLPDWSKGRGFVKAASTNHSQEGHSAHTYAGEGSVWEIFSQPKISIQLHRNQKISANLKLDTSKKNSPDANRGQGCLYGTQKYQSDYVLCPENIMAIISASLDPKIPLLVILRHRNLGLFSLYAHIPNPLHGIEARLK